MNSEVIACLYSHDNDHAEEHRMTATYTFDVFFGAKTFRLFT
jgi:hypothetical protein